MANVRGSSSNERPIEVAGLEVEPQMPRSETEAKDTLQTRRRGVNGSPTFHDLIIIDFAKGIDFDAAPAVQVSSLADLPNWVLLRVQTELNFQHKNSNNTACAGPLASTAQHPHFWFIV